MEYLFIVLNYLFTVLDNLGPAVAGIPLLVSLAYFVLSTGPLWQRLLASAHGVLLVVAGGYAVAVSPWSDGMQPAFLVPFWVLLGLSFASVVYSLFAYRGKRMLIHALVLLFAPVAMWIWFVGTVFITHDGP